MSALLDRRREMMQMGGGSILPPEYQMVEYITMPSGAYIDTGIKSSSDFGVHIKGTNLSDHIAVVTNGNIKGIGLHLYNNSSTAYCWSADGQQQLSITYIYTDMIVELNYLNSGIYTVGGYIVHEGYPADTNYSLYINSWNMWGAMTRGGSGDYKDIKLSRGSEIICDMYPCYRKADNEPGFYDIVNDRFYTNDGSGSMIAGPNV